MSMEKSFLKKNQATHSCSRAFGLPDGPNLIWPCLYLIDKNGYVRYWWYGELNWQGAESEKYLRAKIQELIQEEFVIESTDSAG